jgi:hypothetical protein
VFLIPSSCFGCLVQLNGLPHQCTVVLFVMRGAYQIFTVVPSCGFSIIILCTIVDHAVCWDCLSAATCHVTGDAATCTKRTCEYGSCYKLFWLMDAVLELISHCGLLCL